MDNAPHIAPGTRARLRRTVLSWYGKHGRKLPWRSYTQAYPVLVSEIMLQQTQVSRVLVKLPEFLAIFPSVRKLANATQRDVVTVWKGMGYNNRAVRLHRLARIVVERHGGTIPETLDELHRLPGIGRYTAHAMLAFAHRQPVPLVDINIRRLLSRLFWRMADAGALRSEGDVWAVAARLVPARQAYDWNQALMDLGAMICTARTPRCERCPVRRCCLSAVPRERQRNAVRREPMLHGLPVRVYRGKLIDALRDRKSGLPWEKAESLLFEHPSRANRPWLNTLVQALERDGLVTVRHTRSGRRLVTLA